MSIVVPVCPDYLIIWNLEKFWDEHGYGPTLIELALLCGFKPNANGRVRYESLHKHLERLKDQGYLDSDWGVPRSWRPKRYI